MSTTERRRGHGTGLFITFEGPDGSGKSTQARLLAERLRQAGREVLESVEPGGTPIGQQIRRILLDPANKELAATAELLLMFAARAQNVEQWILPALHQGNIVVSDRFTDSSIAYQGSGRGLGWETVYQLDRIACKGLVPDLTICIDIDTETGLARALARESAAAPELRFEEQAIEFHHLVRDAYHELARRDPQRFRLIDGRGTPDAVAEKVSHEFDAFVAGRKLD
ncbi:MAG: dTMP kinase [Bryobacteraceae bacterium]